jgi:hypothetical protein
LGRAIRQLPRDQRAAKHHQPLAEIQMIFANLEGSTSHRRQRNLYRPMHKDILGVTLLCDE